jgi:lysophospholipid acyltransferase (LPLAT)-like uncharacterized protein
MPQKKSDSLKYFLASSAITGYLHLVGKTTPVKWTYNDKVRDLEKEGKNFIYAIWHCRLAFLIYTHKFTKVCALVSQSKDGEYLAKVLKNFGMCVTRGSTSKGGTSALLGLIDKANEGYHPILTPDGPRGPRGSVQQGILFLAQKTGLPIVPVSCGLERKKVFRSWDRFQLPLPFGRAHVVYGNPINVGKNDSLKQKAEEIKQELIRITDIADKNITQ